MEQAWETVRQLWDGFLASLPRLGLAVLILAVFYFVGSLVRRIIRRWAEREGQYRHLEIAVGRLAHAGIVLVGALVAATAAFPGFTPADLVGALGLGSVAIGFAFKDIFQNFLAGILILVTRPFVVGDQIIVGEYEGDVEQIHTRATYLKTYDGRRVVIPNSDLFTRSVIVNTAFPTRRIEYDIGIGYGDQVDRAKEIVLKVLVDTEDVLPDPKADVIVIALDESSVNLRARWWSKSRIGDVLVAQDKVLQVIKERLQAAGIDLPYPTRQILLHDQTEETDGDRSRQREGWPAGDGDIPSSRSVAGAIERAKDG